MSKKDEGEEGTRKRTRRHTQKKNGRKCSRTFSPSQNASRLEKATLSAGAKSNEMSGGDERAALLDLVLN